MPTLLLALVSAPAGELTPRQILDRVDDMYRGESSHGTMTMKVVTEHWNREITIEGWSKGKELSLMRILSPKKEKGTATLKSGKNIWNYLPKVRRIIKVPSSMMGGSWMGSHFTNDDLVRESRMADDYDFALGPTADKNVAVIECKPKEDAAVVWGKVVVRVRRNDWMPLNMEYFDEDMELARTMTFTDFKKLHGRLMPTLTRMTPSDKPDEFTEMRYEDIEFDITLDPDLFTLRRLQR